MSIISKISYPSIRLSACISAQRQTYAPAVIAYGSVIVRHKSTVEKAKDLAHDVNLKAGKKLSKAINSVEDVAETTAEKAHNLKKQIEHETDHQAHHKVKEGADSISDVAKKAKKNTHQSAKNLKEKAPSEKTIIETVKEVGHKANVKTSESISEGVNKVNEAVEKAKEMIGVGSKKAEHAADELKDEAKLHIKKAAHHADEIKDKATKAVKEATHKKKSH